MFLKVLIWFSGLIFLGYGIVCVSSLSMVGDFERFGLERLRILTGVLEIGGGAGLLVGLKLHPLLWLSASGLSLLMLIAFGVRLHARDSVMASLPSFLLMLLNLYIAVKSQAIALP